MCVWGGGGGAGVNECLIINNLAYPSWFMCVWVGGGDTHTVPPPGTRINGKPPFPEHNHIENIEYNNMLEMRRKILKEIDRNPLQPVSQSYKAKHKCSFFE